MLTGLFKSELRSLQQPSEQLAAVIVSQTTLSSVASKLVCVCADQFMVKIASSVFV